MGVTIVVDYENIPSKAKNMRDYAKQINEKLLDIYQKLTDMHNYWYGSKYNELINGYNRIIPGFNQFLETIVLELPSAFEMIANNISNVDIQKNITTVQKDAPKKITEVSVGKESELKYVKTEVEKIQQVIEKDFKETCSLIENISKIVAQIGITCNGFTEFKTQINKLVKTYSEKINTILKEFSSYMSVVKTQMELAEKANTKN